MRSIKQLLVISVALVTALNCIAEVKIEEKVVGPAFGPGVVYTLSPKGMHVATAHGRDGKTLVTVDGADGPLMDRIFDGAAFGSVVKISEDGYYTRTEQKWTGPIAFSPNGERHAYRCAGRSTFAPADTSERSISSRTPYVDQLNAGE